MTDMVCQWIEGTMDHLTQSQKKKIPKYMRLAALGEDGQVYISSSIASDNHEMVFMCASFDGISAIVNENHIYYPSTWIAREFPKSKELAEKIERIVRGHFV